MGNKTFLRLWTLPSTHSQGAIPGDTLLSHVLDIMKLQNRSWGAWAPYDLAVVQGKAWAQQRRASVMLGRTRAALAITPQPGQSAVRVRLPCCFLVKSHLLPARARVMHILFVGSRIFKQNEMPNLCLGSRAPPPSVRVLSREGIQKRAEVQEKPKGKGGACQAAQWDVGAQMAAVDPQGRSGFSCVLSSDQTRSLRLDRLN